MIKKTNTILDKIIHDVRIDIENRKNEFSLEELILLTNNLDRNIVSLKDRIVNRSILSPKTAKISIIGEIKRASPTKGIFDTNFVAVDVANAYAKSGVSAISVLTEQNHFLGKIDDLKNCYEFLTKQYSNARPAILRKDFIVDIYQIYESYMNGADAFLLIAKLLDQDDLSAFCKLGKELGMQSLVEVQNLDELDTVLSLGFEIIGINNRNLEDFSEDIHTTVALSSKIPKNIVVVSESGIKKQEDVELLLNSHVQGMLIGEAFLSDGFDSKKLLDRVHSLMLVE
ncbi:MAG: indole-3-glycerol phosphate synthase TrpC [Dehalococcoidia bacterium]|nr:indole-3-glycerol phosphate synthase TrpC [Dehalococcoidia bacterium]